MSAVRHQPVLLAEVVAALSADNLGPQDGAIYVDGTFGAGGYTAAILDAADCRVFAIDRDPTAIAGGQGLVSRYAGRLTLLEGTGLDPDQARWQELVSIKRAVDHLFLCYRRR